MLLSPHWDLLYLCQGGNSSQGRGRGPSGGQTRIPEWSDNQGAELTSLGKVCYGLILIQKTHGLAVICFCKVKSVQRVSLPRPPATVILTVCLGYTKGNARLLNHHEPHYL